MTTVAQEQRLRIRAARARAERGDDTVAERNHGSVLRVPQPDEERTAHCVLYRAERGDDGGIVLAEAETRVGVESDGLILDDPLLPEFGGILFISGRDADFRASAKFYAAHPQSAALTLAFRHANDFWKRRDLIWEEIERLARARELPRCAAACVYTRWPGERFSRIAWFPDNAAAYVWALHLKPDVVIFGIGPP